MRRSLLALAAGGSLLAGALVGGTALAADVDETEACLDARAVLDSAVADLQAEVGVGLAGASGEGARLLAIIGDEDRAQDHDEAYRKLNYVNAAHLAEIAVEDECAEPVEPTPTPEPTPTTPPGDGDQGDDQDGPRLGANIDDLDGLTGGPTTTSTAPPAGSAGSLTGGQVRSVPRGHVDTGGGPVA